MIEKWRKTERKETGGRHVKNRGGGGGEIRPRTEVKNEKISEFKKSKINRISVKDKGADGG